jgi:hypothetical protein
MSSLGLQVSLDAAAKHAASLALLALPAVAEV